MTKEETIKLIAGRIMDEFRKHVSHIEDWPKIAAAKIYTQWNEYYLKSVTDEEIETRLRELRKIDTELFGETDDLQSDLNFYKLGAKWMRDKIGSFPQEKK